MTIQTLQWKRLAAASLASGLAQIVAGVALYLSGHYFAAWSGLVSLIVLAAGVAFGVRWYLNHAPGGSATYLTAWLAGVIISVLTAILYVIYNVISISYIYPDFFGQMARALGPDAMPPQPTLSSVVVSNLIGLSVRGAVVSALVAMAFRNKIHASVSGNNQS